MNYKVPMIRDLLIAVLPALFLVLAGCSSGDNGDSDVVIEEPLQQNIPELYSTVRFIDVEVVYEPGAEPFTGATAGGTQYWSIFEQNIQALFQERSIVPQVSVPKDLSGMVRIDPQNQPSWTVEEIVGLAGMIAGNAGDPSIAEIYVMFLKGYFNEEGADNPKVIGVSVIGTPVIAVFKDVVLATSATSLVARYVEQATVVHEFGHLAGLVDSGVPMVSPHLDPEHLKHCTNDTCVMYWQNEGAEDLAFFVQQMIDTGSLVMFGPECLQDTRSYIPQ
jgi:hypothetical protein